MTGEADLARALRQVIDLKDAGHYGLADVSLTRAKLTMALAEAPVMIGLVIAFVTNGWLPALVGGVIAATRLMRGRHVEACGRGAVGMWKLVAARVPSGSLW